jgi:hypothetical protein
LFRCLWLNAVTGYLAEIASFTNVEPSKMIDYQEKRDFYRMNMDCSAEYSVNGSGEKGEAIVKDLSSGGLLLWVKQELKPGSEVSIFLQPGSDITPPLNAKVEVIRCDPIENEQDTYAAACSMIEILD